MAAMSPARRNAYRKEQYEEILIKTGILIKTDKKVKKDVVIQRKLLLIVYTLLTKNETDDPNYHKKMKEKLVPKITDIRRHAVNQMSAQGLQKNNLPISTCSFEPMLRQDYRTNPDEGRTKVLQTFE